MSVVLEAPDHSLRALELVKVVYMHGSIADLVNWQTSHCILLIPTPSSFQQGHLVHVIVVERKVGGGKLHRPSATAGASAAEICTGRDIRGRIEHAGPMADASNVGPATDGKGGSRSESRR